jgi:hypothetical protein
MTGSAAGADVMARPVRRSAFAGALLGVGTIVAGAVAGSVSCGGTTGREGLPTATSSSNDQDAGMPDATLGTGTASDSGLIVDAFDVQVPFANPDRLMPELEASDSVEAGEAGTDGGGPPWDCPPFIGQNNHHGTVAWGGPGNPEYQIPSAYGDGGNIVIAPDGSACGTYPWLGSTSIDTCSTMGTGVTEPQLPPCALCVDAGVASGGSGAGSTRYALCQALYECQVSTRCMTGPGAAQFGAIYCLCGSDPNCKTTGMNPQGPCAVAEMAAFEANPQEPGAVATVLNNYYDIDPTQPFYCAANLNGVWADGLLAGCYSQGDAGDDSGDN